MPEMSETSVGFVGAGDLGGEVVRRMLAAGLPVTLYARREEVRREYAALGAAIAPDLVELGRRSDVVGVCVVDDAQVREVLLGPGGVLAGLEPGGLIAIHSTIHPETCRELAASAATGGVAVIDAPISSSGGFHREERPLTAMVGGEAADFARARPVLESFATMVRHVGPLGSGEVAKIVNNCLYYAQKALAVDAVAIAGAAGLDTRAVGEVWAASSGESRALEQYRLTSYGALIPRTVGSVDQSLAVIRKDLRLAAELAAAGGVPAATAIAMGEHLVELIVAEAG